MGVNSVVPMPKAPMASASSGQVDCTFMATEIACARPFDNPAGWHMICEDNSQVDGRWTTGRARCRCSCGWWRRGSFSAAARQLHMTPSTISKLIGRNRDAPRRAAAGALDASPVAHRRGAGLFRAQPRAAAGARWHRGRPVRGRGQRGRHGACECLGGLRHPGPGTLVAGLLGGASAHPRGPVAVRRDRRPLPRSHGCRVPHRHAAGFHAGGAAHRQHAAQDRRGAPVPSSATAGRRASRISPGTTAWGSTSAARCRRGC